MPPVTTTANANRTKGSKTTRLGPGPSLGIGLGLGLALLAAAGVPGCAGRQGAGDRALDPNAPELELTYDSGSPEGDARPQLPPPESEWLVRFDPALPSPGYRPVRLRLLVAQPGKLHLTLYAEGEGGRPGATLRTIDRDVSPELTSGGRDGKWLVVALGDVPAQTAPLFLGLSAPETGGARLWTVPNTPRGGDPDRPELAPVFRRDPEPATALQSTRLQVVPLARLVVSPQAARPTGQ